MIWEKDFNINLIQELESQFQEVTVAPVAIVCLIGSNIDQPGVLAKASEALAGKEINIISAGFSMRKVNLQFIIQREDFKEAVIALNNTMYF